MFAFMLWLVFTLVAGSMAAGPSSNDCCPEVCVLDDLDCVTKGALGLYKKVVCEKNGKVCLDPLHIDRIGGTTDYELTNIVVKGLCDCIVTKGVMITNSQTYKQYLNCPKLEVTYEFQLSDASCTEPIKVKVDLEVCDYHIKSTGSYGIFINNMDNLPHFYVQDVCTIVKLLGVVRYTLTATCKGDPTTIDHPDKAVLQDIAKIIKKALVFVMIAHDDVVGGQPLGVTFPANN